MTQFDIIKQQLEDTERLINMQHDEIVKLRYIVSRYHKQYGEEIFTGELWVPDEVDMFINRENKCKVLESEYPIISTYQKMLDLRTKLFTVKP